MEPPAPLDPPAPSPALDSALARLEARWGSAAIRLGSGGRIGRGEGEPGGRERDQDGLTSGALALAPMAAPAVGNVERVPAPDPREVVSTGFPALDAILAAGGLPRRASVTLRGAASSGKTTLALRCLAEAQATGSIVAWLDLPQAFDPLEAAARGVDLDWLIVLRPADADEGFRLAGALLAGRAVDLLVLDLPPRLRPGHEAILRRLAAHGRRTGARLLALAPTNLAGSLHGALAESTGLRLELRRAGWIRLGRDVIGQRTAVRVAKDHGGMPGREAELAIRYLDPGERGPALDRLSTLGADTGPPERSRLPGRSGPPGRAGPHGRPPLQPTLRPPFHEAQTIDDAPPPPRLDPPAASARRRPAPVAPRSARDRRTALGAG
ncbi:MAG TPA: hypothetical protein VFW86_02795 [Candidatus Limnocylindrales bacterium]|jgi:RecA/RadA recombinase|nr:hypothetical protein [Candidatus Limnocylindrales bacterium]